MSKNYFNRPEDDNLELYTGYTYGKELVTGSIFDYREIARLEVLKYVYQSLLVEIEKEATHYRDESEPYSENTLYAFYKKI